MKKFICLLVSVITFSIALTSCDLNRKLEGVEIKFQQKISAATEFSFNAALKITSDGEENNIDVKCYKNGDEYAYVFGDKDDETLTYRRLYADGKLYEFLTKTVVVVDGGSYFVKENTSVSDDDNFLYHLTNKILLATYATILLNGKKEKVGETDAYRYDIPHDGNSYSLWYDDENLIKIAATINSTDDNGGTHTDVYEAVFTDYRFADISKDPFKRPTDMPVTYIESPIPFESWVSIFTSFGKMSAAWLG